MSNNVSESLSPAAAANNPGHLVVSTRFMEQFEMVRPVTGGGDIVPFRNAAGALDVYSSGTGSAVFRIREQSGNTAGWVQTELGISASQLAPYVIGGISADNPNILGVDAAAVLTLSTYEPGTGRYRQRVSQPSGNTRKLKQFRAAAAIDGNVHANVILDNDEVATSFLKRDGTWASNGWVPIKAGSGSSDNAKAKLIAMCANNPVQTSLYAVGMNGEVLFAESSFRFSHFVRLGTLTAIDLNVVEDAEKRLNIFAIDNKRRLWQKREKKHPVGPNIEWEDWTRVDDTTDVVGLRAVLGFNDGVEIFAIGADGRLYITRAREERGVRTWSRLFPLGNPVPNNVFNAGRNGQGYSEVFSVTRDSRLYRFWQDPTTTQWYDYEIKPQETAEMKSIAAHSVQIQVLDERGVAKVESDVTVRTSALVPLRINGLYYTTGELVEAKVKSNSAGIVTIERFTNSLSAPSLLVRTPFMSESEGVVVEPNGALQDKLHRTSADDVWNARGADGQFLLKGDNRTRENAESIAKIMDKSMSLGFPSIQTAASQRFLSRNVRTTGLRHVSLQSGVSPFRLDLAAVAEQHWQVDFSSGFPRYRELSRDDAAALLQQRSALAADAGLLGFDWGDLWNSIKKGVSDVVSGLKDFVVSTIIDPISGLVKELKVQFQLFIDGVTRFIDATIEFFQQAFDIVEGIWNKIKVFFEDLFKWLGFLFAWGDIKRTAEVVEHTFNTALDFMAAGVKSVRNKVNDGLLQFEKDVKKWMDDYIASLGGDDLKKVIDSQPQPSSAQTEGTAHNPLLNAFMERKGDARSTSAAAAGGIDTFKNIVEELEKLANNFQFGSGKEAFDQARDYFKQVGKDPDNFLNLIYKGLLKVGEAVALWGIAAARGVIVSVLDVIVDLIGAMKTLLNEEWEIPFVSQLYQLITGESLTFRPLRLTAYLVAIPGTIVYKLITNTAPFADQASVDAFRTTFTVAWLEEQSGTGPSTVQARQRLMHGEALSRFNAMIKTITRVFAVFFAITWLLRMWFETTTALAAGTEQALPKLFSVATIVTIFLTSFFSTPWLVADNAGGFGCKDKPLNNLRWLLNIVFGPFLGLCIFIVKAAGAKFGPEPREVTLTLWGAANLGMAIAVAAYGVTNLVQTVINILMTLAPQLLRFLCIPKLVAASDGITLGVLVGLIVGTYFGIASYYIDMAINSTEVAAVNERVLKFAIA